MILVATVPTACGIETSNGLSVSVHLLVATVPTACGIETSVKVDAEVEEGREGCNSAYRLRY